YKSVPNQPHYKADSPRFHWHQSPETPSDYRERAHCYYFSDKIQPNYRSIPASAPMDKARSGQNLLALLDLPVALTWLPSEHSKLPMHWSSLSMLLNWMWRLPHSSG